MTDISVQEITKAFEEGKNILDGVSFDIGQGEHVGLLGKNGAGKTTLFRIISGELIPDSGEVSIPHGKRVGLVSQISLFPEGYTVEDVLKSAHERVYMIGKRMSELEHIMAANPDKGVLQEYDRLAAEFLRLDGYELERLRNTVANGLGITPEMRGQDFDTLSGGEKTRINLARLILEDTDILLLDEPTNHLDIASSEWLEGYLSKYRGTAAVISHDRCFLDRVVGRIVDLKDGKAEFYSGNYSFYVAEKKRRYEEKLKKYEKDQEKIAQLTKAADRIHLWAFMGSDKLHKRAFSMEKRIERLQSTERPTAEGRLSASIFEKAFKGDEVVNIKNLSKSYGNRELFSDIELDIKPAERIALIGKNGSGKTTMLRLMLGLEKADSGKISRGPSVKTAYLPQNVTFENPQLSLLDTLVYLLDMTPQTARNRLGAFRFSGDDVFKSVSQLSGGERSRLMLCMLLNKDVNFLVLDEPTNHLDTASREWMEEALEHYGEALLFVSHDRYFISRFATRIWELENGHIFDFHGTLEQFRAYKDKVSSAQITGENDEQPKKHRKQKKLNGSPEKLMAKLEREISEGEMKLRELEKEAEEYLSDYQRLMELEVRRAEISTELDKKYIEWAEIAEEQCGE